MYSYAYLIGTLPWIIIWTAFYVLLPRSRPAILWTSLIFASAGPISEYWSLVDYWHPVYLINITVGRWHFGFEDYFSAFAVTGISAGLFESLAVRKGFVPLSRISVRTVLRMIGWGIVGLFLVAFLASGLHLKSIHALLLSGMITALLMLFRKWKILLLILPIAGGFGVLYWLYYVFFSIPIFPGVIEAWWNLEATWGIMLTGVPIEEILWAFTTALFAGPVFRMCS